MFPPTPLSLPGSSRSCRTGIFSPASALGFGIQAAFGDAADPVFPCLSESHLHQTLRSGGSGFRRLAVQNAAVEPAQHAHPRCRVRPSDRLVSVHLPLSPFPIPAHDRTVPLPPPAPPRVPAPKHRPLGSVFIGRPPGQSGLGFILVWGVFQACAPALELLTLGKCGAAYVNFSLFFFFFVFVLETCSLGLKEKNERKWWRVCVHTGVTVAGRDGHGRCVTSSLLFTWAVGWRNEGPGTAKPCPGWPKMVSPAAGGALGAPLVRAGVCG